MIGRNATHLLRHLRARSPRSHIARINMPKNPTKVTSQLKTVQGLRITPATPTTVIENEDLGTLHDREITHTHSKRQGDNGGLLRGWLDSDLGVPPWCPPAAQPVLPDFHLSKQTVQQPKQN